MAYNATEGHSRGCPELGLAMNDIPPLTDRQLAIIDLIRAGATDHMDIAEELDVSRNAVRRDVSVLCARYRCSLRELPAAVETEASKERGIVDEMLMDVARSVGKQYGMTDSQVIQQIAIGDIPHPDAPEDECGATDPRDDTKWCVRRPEHTGMHNWYARDIEEGP